ncbi:MAG: hypothetical protein AB7T37_02550 [Dehalococcoidia bacterium]
MAGKPASLQGSVPQDPGSGSFESRLRALYDRWEERREIGLLARSHDFASQFELLRRMHGWATECSEAVVRVYGAELPVTLSPMPDPGDNPAFTLSIGRGRVTFSLINRDRATSQSWFITGQRVAAGSGTPSAVGPHRSDGSWSRPLVEELLLDLVAAFERRRARPIELHHGPRDSRGSGQA